jgi:hypothetical protein
MISFNKTVEFSLWSTSAAAVLLFRTSSVRLQTQMAKHLRAG